MSNLPILETVRVADFTRRPGGRDKVNGKNSAEEFYFDYLKPAYEKVNGKEGLLLVDLDGVSGYSTSWLNGVFERLIKEFGSSSWDKLLIKAKLASNFRRVRYQFFPEERPRGIS